jgi:hypothetical protein
MENKCVTTYSCLSFLAFKALVAAPVKEVKEPYLLKLEPWLYPLLLLMFGNLTSSPLIFVFLDL